MQTSSSQMYLPAEYETNEPIEKKSQLLYTKLSDFQRI